MAYSVSFVNRYIRSLIESDMQLSDVEVEGEVSDITFHRSGHVYFTLKEENSVLSAVMFRSNAASLDFKPVTGDKVICRGRITTYEARGSYQLVAVSMRQKGQGELYKKFMELKDKLEEKGMFDEQYKRPIPSYINTLGVVTSPTGAAIRDIINITKRRNPFVQIILAPALVQGDGAGESIADAINYLSSLNPDVMIVGRGGGSMEDLWPFNEEVVADAIFASDIPIISAVGHETNFSISDFVSDLRAPTPSAAAELAVYDVYDLFDELGYIQKRMESNINHLIDQKRQKALDVERRLSLLSPKGRIEQSRSRLSNIRQRFEYLMQQEINDRRQRLKSLAAGLSALSPAARLSQGYAYITAEDGKNIKSIKHIKPGELLNARLSDGNVVAKVEEIQG